jgi:hypothetical protein
MTIHRSDQPEVRLGDVRCQLLLLVQWVQDVALYAHHPGSDGPQRCGDATTAAPHVMTVHLLGDLQVRHRVEAVYELTALILQVLTRLEQTCFRALLAAEFSVVAVGRAVGDHRHLTRHRQTGIRGVAVMPSSNNRDNIDNIRGGWVEGV